MVGQLPVPTSYIAFKTAPVADDRDRWSLTRLIFALGLRSDHSEENYSTAEPTFENFESLLRRQSLYSREIVPDIILSKGHKCT